ncbi:IS3 family transposase [Lactococcus lactis]|uniref:IS3 family transposase n=2 Tax=Lactococcus lactis TaxID=1358 RepID=UPI003F8311BC
MGRAHQRKQLIFKTIDELCQQYPISRLCNYFKVSRSGYYAWKKLGKPSYKNYDRELASKIMLIFNERNKGYRYIKFQLEKKFNITRNPKTILRYMRILNIKSPIRKKKYFHYSRKEISINSILVAPNILNRDFKAKAPFEKLVTDVSYIYYKTGRLFLSVVKDLFDNSILAYQISKKNDIKLVMDNLSQVFSKQSHNCILHSDQGFQYTSRIYKDTLESLGITISHSRKGNCYDNRGEVTIIPTYSVRLD